MINLDECELVIFISTLACAVSKCYTDDEITLMAALFNQLGDTLSSIIAKRSLCVDQSNSGKVIASRCINGDCEHNE